MLRRLLRPDTADGLAILLRFLKPYRAAAVGLIVLGILASALEAVGLTLLAPILQAMSSTGPATVGTGNALFDRFARLIATTTVTHRLQAFVAVLLALIVLKNVVTYFLAIATAAVQHRVITDLRLAVFQQFMGVSYRHISQSRTGDLITTLNEETVRTGMAFQYLMQGVSTILLIVAYGTLLVIISPLLTLAAVVYSLFLSWVLRRHVKAAQVVGERLTRIKSRLAQVSLEALGGMRVVRSFGQEAYEQERYEECVEEFNRINLRSIRLASLVMPLVETLSSVLLGVVFILAAHRIFLAKDLVLPLIVTFLFVLYRLLPRVGYLNTLRVLFSVNLGGVKAVTRALDTRDKPYVVSGSRPFRELRQGIRFEDVSFAYDHGDGAVLSEVTFDLPVGRTTALVGASGVGKSTLADLVLRFYDPDQGRITVDGVDLRELDLAQWRAGIGVVGQDTFIFNASVRWNIAYGRPGATESEVVEAARLADADAFIANLSKGYDTLLGDRGVRLSAGQRQRIAIARAILRNPQILILDEATSALDSETEWNVQQALYALSERRTVLVIAHRLSTIVEAEQIVVLDDSRVIETGTHEELLDRHGRYRAFWDLQGRELQREGNRVP